MIKINYPEKKPPIRNESGKQLIFCIIRKRWIQITPEEWVRQNFLLFLIETLYYPASLIAVEKQLMAGDLKKRFDIVVFDKNAKPFMIVECKEMNVSLSENVLRQVLNYNIHIKAKYLAVTNGIYCRLFKHEDDQFVSWETMPQMI